MTPSMDMPADPFGDDYDNMGSDACVAIGISVLDSFARGADVVVVRSFDRSWHVSALEPEGGWPDTAPEGSGG